jgi:hypothetical protein
MKRKGNKKHNKRGGKSTTQKSHGEIANKCETIQKCDIRVHLRVYITTEGRLIIY